MMPSTVWLLVIPAALAGCVDNVELLRPGDLQVLVRPGADASEGTSLDQRENAACGVAGEACCEGSPHGGTAPNFCVDSLLGCIDSRCAPCGGDGQPCCPATACRNAGCCDHSKVGGTCVGSGDVCGDGSTCSQSGCGSCGRAGQSECGAGVECTAPLTTQQDPNLCVACGGNGQPCCERTCSSSSLACSKSSICVPCGDGGQPCCQGSICKSGTCGQSISDLCPP